MIWTTVVWGSLEYILKFRATTSFLFSDDDDDKLCAAFLTAIMERIPDVTRNDFDDLRWISILYRVDDVEAPVLSRSFRSAVEWRAKVCEVAF